jgi:hypothetical protein
MAGTRDIFLHKGPNPSLLSSGYLGLFAQGVKLTSQLHLVPRLRMSSYTSTCLMCLHGAWDDIILF